MFKKYLFTNILYLLLIISSCENPITGYGPQPTFIDEHRHNPLLNVLGVLRPDSLNGFPLSYVHLEGSYAVTSQYPDSFIIPDAQVILFSYKNNEIRDSLECAYTNFGLAQMHKEYRTDRLHVRAGNTYGLSCRKEGYPLLTAKTTVPAIPEIVGSTLALKNNTLSFTIKGDSLAGLYDIYLWIGQKSFFKRVIPALSKNTDIVMDFTQHTETKGFLAIYAYDLNLTKYFTASISIKPNTYQPAYSTVQNGYGSFGSLNILYKNIQL